MISYTCYEPLRDPGFNQYFFFLICSRNSWPVAKRVKLWGVLERSSWWFNLAWQGRVKDQKRRWVSIELITKALKLYQVQYLSDSVLLWNRMESSRNGPFWSFLWKLRTQHSTLNKSIILKARSKGKGFVLAAVTWDTHTYMGNRWAHNLVLEACRIRVPIPPFSLCSAGFDSWTDSRQMQRKISSKIPEATQKGDVGMIQWNYRDDSSCHVESMASVWSCLTSVPNVDHRFPTPSGMHGTS